jgi:uncharacterized protein with GYD domain
MAMTNDRAITHLGEVGMPKYLLKATLSAEGTQGTLKEGGTARRAAVEQTVKNAGGSLESFYYAFGGTDVYVIVELPDNSTAAAVAMGVSAAGSVRGETVVLLTPEEIDAAAGKNVTYRPPGA